MTLYDRISKSILKNKSNLTPLLVQLHDEIKMNDQTLQFKGKDHQQILAQIYSHIKRPLNQIQKQYNRILQENNINGVDNSSQGEGHSQIDEEHLPDEEMEEYDDNMDQYENMDEGEYPEEQPEEDEELNGYDEQLMEGQEDVGLYGEQLDQQQMESYENQSMEGDKEFNQGRDFGEGGSDEGDEAIEDNFDHFRQVQLKNQETQNQQKSKLQNQIQNLEKKALQKKNWTLQGEVRAKDRPANSLLQYDLQFNSGLKYKQEINQQHNEELDQMIKQRILDELFDDRVRYNNINSIREHFGSLKDVSTQKSTKGLAELYELEFKNYMGIGDNKNDKLKKQIMDSFKELNYYLDSLSNMNFTPKPTLSSNSHKKTGQAIITEEKVPITLWEGNQTVEKSSTKFESDKQIDKKAKRLKNKRISRQRKKEQMKKKLNKKIEYGGVTKYEAEIRKKMLKNKEDRSGTKYSKSSSFFKNLNERPSTKARKPNPNISKMKI